MGMFRTFSAYRINVIGSKLHRVDCCTLLLPEMKTLSFPRIDGIMPLSRFSASMFSLQIVGDRKTRRLGEMLGRFLRSLF
jgi:hypothetical protein